MKYTNDKDFNRAIRDLVREGWTFEKGGKHSKLRSPSGSEIAVPGSPSDWRALKNFQAFVKQVKEIECQQ